MSDPNSVAPGDPTAGRGSQQGDGSQPPRGGVASPFTPEAEKKEFEKDDIQAGGAVMVLMTAIFIIGRDAVHRGGAGRVGG